LQHAAFKTVSKLYRTATNRRMTVVGIASYKSKHANLPQPF